MGSTTKELVQDLFEIIKKDGGHPKAYAIGNIAADAQKGKYHDFLSPLATPKIQLHMDLLELGLEEIDRKMQNGEYDDEDPTDTL